MGMPSTTTQGLQSQAYAAADQVTTDSAAVAAATTALASAQASAKSTASTLAADQATATNAFEVYVNAVAADLGQPAPFPTAVPPSDPSTPTPPA